MPSASCQPVRGDSLTWESSDIRTQLWNHFLPWVYKHTSLTSTHVVLSLTFSPPVISLQAASLPMSIIIVGVGPAEFDGKCASVSDVTAYWSISDMSSAVQSMQLHCENNCNTWNISTQLTPLPPSTVWHVNAVLSSSPTPLHVCSSSHPHYSII